MAIEDILKKDAEFCYMLLDRMRTDCEYYLGNAPFYGAHLWASNERDQIAYMKAIWNSFPENAKPKWLSMEKIEEYESLMCK